MARTTIRDQRGFIIGHIEDMTHGRQRAFDFGGRILGTYDPTTGKTVDDTFRIVGTGNQLMGLIERAR
ncbi:hypothetical protein [Sphingomonas lacusdianchii]|uniref:hypothetical protein n=1 Tax=Sphingomonas lacusdianchii TaxID=2917992 RepID=UPI001F5976CE|nr:hypothetical protein [Sphingomonas sp. JXJ CY 53]